MKTLVLMAGLLALLGPVATQAEPVKIRIQYASTSQFVPMIPLAPKELYKHYGVSYTVEPVFMPGSGPALTALAANEIHLAALNPQTIGNLVLTAGLDPRAIVQVISSDVPGYAGAEVWCQDSFKKIEDLKGRTVGINTRGSTPDVGVKVMLGRHGIGPTEYQAVEMAFPSAIPALDAKRVDCAVLVSPWYLHMEKKAGFRMLFTLGEVLGPQENVTWVGKPDWIAKNRAALVDFVEDHIRMRHWVQDAPTHDQALKLASQIEKRPVEDIAYLWTKKDNFHHPDGQINVERMQKNFDDLVTFGLLPSRVEAAKHVDATIQREALARTRPQTN